jgi:hypothetical protein
VEGDPVNDTEPIQRAIFLRELAHKIKLRSNAGDTLVHEFLQAVDARLAKGAIEYGDTSPSKPFAVLADEVEQELLDVAGWCCQLWRKLNMNIGNGETIYGQHPKVQLAERIGVEAAEAFASWRVWRESVVPLCKELDARA